MFGKGAKKGVKAVTKGIDAGVDLVKLTIDVLRMLINTIPALADLLLLSLRTTTLIIKSTEPVANILSIGVLMLPGFFILGFCIYIANMVEGEHAKNELIEKLFSNI